MLCVLALCVFVLGSSEGLALAKPQKDLGYETRIIGGQPATEGEFPSQVAIHNTDGFVCGGSILNTEWVLTAATFVFGQHTDTLTVHSGTINLNSPVAIVHNVTTMVVHENYGIWGNKPNDIAVVRVSPRFELDGVSWKAVMLPAPGTIPAESTVATIVGWGDILDFGVPADVLRKANVVISNRAACQAYVNSDTYTLADTQICADIPSGGLGSCHRDQGGPMFVAGEVVALITGGEACDPVTYKYAVYTLVSPYATWIRNQTDNATTMPVCDARVVVMLCIVLRSLLTFSS